MITVRTLLDTLPVKATVGRDFEQSVTGGYVSDLLSNVMGQAAAGNVWITMQAHQNVAAVALLANLAAVIIAGGVEPEGAILEKARAEGLNILTTELSAFEVAGRLYQLGVRG